MAGCAAGVQPAPDEPPQYLALGDSVAFGFDPRTDHSTDSGYAELLAPKHELALTNASCPGEASGGFISPDGNDNHCRENKAAYALHTPYKGTQLAFAIDFLKKHPGTTLVTIDLGGNDVGKLNAECAGALTCILGGMVGTLESYDDNMHYILGELRKVYDGPLVGIGIYNPYGNADSTAEWGLAKLNGLMSAQLAQYDGMFVDGLAAFHAVSADPCADGLLIKMPDGTCDIHPSPKGHEILAGAVETALFGTSAQ
ncbi:MAG TPA: SGNH/GDSL hydrolase family protein [Kofleriaceae bacterium]|jgi:lysophospholipase L1-like esterase|nr:SGNH/GDSL hydrolase family protein [Kofleriaceae bacterium]